VPNTLTLGAATVQLDVDLDWTDEFDWSTTQSRRRYSAGGALLLDVGTKLAGRPLTLQGTESSGWMPRSSLLTLRAWTDDQAASMTLSFRGVTYAVGFAAVDAPVTCVPVAPWVDPIATDWVVPTIRLITL
jgi:hypothetical protein